MILATFLAAMSYAAEPQDIGTEDGWIPVLAESPEYQDLAGAELLLVGRVGGHGAYPVGHPEQAQYTYTIQMDTPWLPVADLEDCQGAFDRLRGERSPPELFRTAVLTKAKLKHDRSRGRMPVVVVGWMRNVQNDDEEWDCPWLANLPLLPDKREVFSIPLIAACEATTEADSALGFSGVHHARQDFKVLTVFHGDATSGQRMTISYSYGEGRGRDVAQGERVIWVMSDEQFGIRGYAAVPDTPYHRKEAQDLAARVRAASPRTRYDLLDIGLKAEVATSREAEVPDLFVESSNDAKVWELRKEVDVVYSGPDGEVYFVPDKKIYYVRRDIYTSTGRRIQPTYFGPFQKDPSLLPQK